MAETIYRWYIDYYYIIIIIIIIIIIAIQVRLYHARSSEIIVRWRTNVGTYETTVYRTFLVIIIIIIVLLHVYSDPESDFQVKAA